MKTFTEFKEYLQEKKSKTEYKATDLDKQITQEIDAAKEDGDTESISKLEAIRDEKDKEVKESRFKIYMSRKKEEEDSEEDSDTNDVQEEINKEKVKGCLNLSKEEEEHKMEILRNKRKAGKSKINEKQEISYLDRFRTMKFNKNAPDFTSEQMKYYSKIKNYIVAAKDKARALQDAKIQIEKKYSDNPKVAKTMIAQANILAKQ